MNVLSNVTLLAADTARSRAYAQILAHHGWQPGAVLLFGGASGRPGQGQPAGVDSLDDLFVPDFGEPLEATCVRLGWDLHRLAADSVNAPEVKSELQSLQPELVIYSGFGGQIVKGDVLHCSGPFLHMHPGWLPEFRGSTTVYYSWLLENNTGVSAILLEEKIDTGPIIDRQRYPAPPQGVDVDYLYDTVIRADLLARVMKKYDEQDGQLSTKPQPAEGRNYYVIHPLLKHLALLAKASDTQAKAA